MSKTSKSKALQIFGAVLVLTSPLWLYIGPNLISPLLCDPNKQVYNPKVYGNYEIYPCADDTITLTASLVIGSLLVGALLIYLAGNSKRINSKK